MSANPRERNPMVLETPEIGLLVVTVAFMPLDIVTGLAKGAKA